MLLSIHLHNWKSHDETTLKLRKGTDLFIGQMGSGKSSVLDAISYSLFGTFPNLDRKRVTRNGLFRLNENDILLELVFMFNKKTYKVQRTITRKIGKKTTITTDAKLYENDKLIEKGQKVVSNRIGSILNVDYPLFTRAIYSEQNNIDYFIGLDPAKRKGEIDRLLGMDKFEKARLNITSMINTTRIKRKTLSESYDDTLLTKLVDESQKLENDYKKQIDNLQIIQKEQKNYIGERDKIKKKYEEITALRTKFNNTKRQEERLNGEIKSLKNELEHADFSIDILNETKKMEENIEGINKNLIDIRQQLTNYGNERSELMKKMGYYNSNISRIDTDLKHITELRMELNNVSQKDNPEDLEKQINNMTNELNNLTSKTKYLIVKISEEREHMDKLRPGLSKCPVCETPLNENKISSIISEKKLNIERFLGEKNDSNKSIQNLKDEIEKLKIRMNKMNRINQNLNIYLQRSSKSKKEEYEKNSKKINENIRMLNNKIVNLEKTNNEKLEIKRALSLEQEKLIRLFRLKGIYEEKAKEINKIVNNLKEINYNESRFKEIENQWINIRTKYDTLTQRVELKKREIDILKNNMDRIKTQIDGISRVEIKIKKLLRLEEELLYFKDIIIEVQVNLRAELMESINKTIAELWTLFYPYQNYGGIRITPGEKDYIFEIKHNDVWKPLEALASGGERACAALSFRVALAMVLTPSLSWFILDEPTHNLDRSAVNLLSDALQHKIPDLVEQTIVITHNEELIGDNFGITYRFSRDNTTTNSSTKIEEM